MASQSKTHVFLLPELIDDIPKNTSPRETKVENALRAMAFGPSSSLGPRRNTHGFTKLNSCQLLRLVRSLIIINLFRPDTLFISPWKKSFIARLSELAGYLALPELGKAQPQLVIHLYL
jgi:hypothetical protein